VGNSGLLSDGTFIDSVFASAPDGSGGWFIGGDFSEVGNVAVENLAHILSNGTVDTSWEPATDGPVYALAVANGEVFAGGSFANAFAVAYDPVTGVPRNDVAAFGVSGGAVEPWDPDVTTTAVPTPPSRCQTKMRVSTLTRVVSDGASGRVRTGPAWCGAVENGRLCKKANLLQQ
jgi:hypothetical protein